MLKKRIIPCLDIKEGRTVKGINFMDIKDAGDPVELAQGYAAAGADELVFLDITATNEKRKTFIELVRRIAAKINMPFAVGGGISSIQDVAALLEAGADKVSINSAAVNRPALITETAQHYGSQCCVVAVDTKYTGGRWEVYSAAGTRATGMETVEWARRAAELGAGEILLTSMNNDGTQAGFALDITAAVAAAVNIPVTASGGAGSEADFAEVFSRTKASGALAASIFHYGQVAVPALKNYLHKQGVPVRI